MVDIKQKITSMEDKIRTKMSKLTKYEDPSLLKLDSKELGEEISKFQELYNQLLVDLDKYYEIIADDNISDEEIDNYFDTYEEMTSSVSYIYQSHFPVLVNKQTTLLNTKVEKLNNKLETSLGTQFGIFSALLSILAFVLTNAKILTIESISFKNVLLVNLSYILVCSVLFYFVLWFIKPYKHSKGRVWSLVAIIIALCLCIYKVATVM